MSTLGKLSLDKFLLEGLTTGKKWAEGVADTDANGYITVTGLDFVPTVVVTWWQFDTGYDKSYVIYDGETTYRVRYGTAMDTTAGAKNEFVGSTDGFTMLAYQEGTSTTGIVWKAFE